MYVSKIKPEYSWSDEKSAIADIADILLQIAYPGQGVKVTRPADVIARQLALKKAHKTRAIIENTKWVETE